MTPLMTHLLRYLALPRGWSGGIRSALCGAAALLNALDLGFQGNGNLIWSGVFLGFVLGLAWSVSLLFGLPSLARGFRPSARIALWVASFFTAFAVLLIICFHIWGH
jgi:hypothetical protein